MASLALLAGCAGAPVTWEGEIAAADVPRSYRWGAVESPPSIVVGAEARLAMDRLLQEHGFTETADAGLVVFLRFEPLAAPDEPPPVPEPSGLGWLVASMVSAFSCGPQPPLLRWQPTQWIAHGRELLEVTMCERSTNRLLCRGRAAFSRSGFADSGHVAAVCAAVAELMATCPLRR